MARGRKGPLRPTVVYRDAPEVLAELDDEANSAGLTRTDYLLQLVAYARENMPSDWPTPAGRTAPKPGISFRDAPDVVDWMNSAASELEISREELIARLVSFSRANMPADAPVPDHPLDRRRGERFSPEGSR